MNIWIFLNQIYQEWLYIGTIWLLLIVWSYKNVKRDKNNKLLQGIITWKKMGLWKEKIEWQRFREDKLGFCFSQGIHLQLALNVSLHFTLSFFMNNVVNLNLYCKLKRRTKFPIYHIIFKVSSFIPCLKFLSKMAIKKRKGITYALEIRIMSFSYTLESGQYLLL